MASTPSSASDLTFDAATHTYRLAGKVLPSVTQIIREAGLVDATWYTEQARERGSAVHLACQLLDEDDLDSDGLDPRIEPYVRAWERYKTEADAEVLETERAVVHRVYGYAGRMDVLARVAGDLAVIDRKTGVAGPAAGVQTMAYARAYTDETGLVIRHRLAVELRADGTYRVVEFTGLNDWKVFAACLTLRAWREANSGR